MSILLKDCTVEIDPVAQRVYVHTSKGLTILRIYGLSPTGRDNFFIDARHDEHSGDRLWLTESSGMRMDEIAEVERD